MGYAVAMEIARQPEGPEVDRDLRKAVSRRSLHHGNSSERDNDSCNANQCLQS